MNLIPNNYPKPDLFLYTKYDGDDILNIDVTNYEINDLLNLLDEENFEISINCLYESSNLDKPIITDVKVSYNYITINFFGPDDASDVTNTIVVYNNKTYYFYFENSNPK